MTDAEKRKKVIRGLECCKWSRQNVEPEKNKCDECPYKDKSIMNAFTVWRSCTNVLAGEALALLKDQEARMIELSEISPNIYVWVEDRDDGTLFPLKGGVIDPDGDDYFRFDADFGEDFVYYPTGPFGKRWRVWDKCPSPEQTRDAKWEEE